MNASLCVSTGLLWYQCVHLLLVSWDPLQEGSTQTVTEMTAESEDSADEGEIDFKPSETSCKAEE